MTSITRLISVALLLTCATATVADVRVPVKFDDPEAEALHYDLPQPNLTILKFKRTDELLPKAKNIRLIEAVFLSNKRGERWAIVTLENTSTGQRLLTKDSIVATFADGSQSYAWELEERLQGSEVITKSVYFGRHKFPIIKVVVE